MSEFITNDTNSKRGENSVKNSDLSSFFHFVHFKLAYKTQIKLSIYRIQQSISINKIQNTKFKGIWIGFNWCYNCLLRWWKNFWQWRIPVLKLKWLKAVYSSRTNQFLLSNLWAIFRQSTQKLKWKCMKNCYAQVNWDKFNFMRPITINLVCIL